MAKQIQYLDLEGLKVLYGVVDGKITTAVTNAKGELKGTATADYDTLGKLEGKIKEEAARATAAETALDDRLDALENGEHSVGAQINAAVDGLKNGASKGYDTLKGLEDKIKEEAARADTAEKANAAAIAAMDLTDKAVDGEFITTVSQTDGKVAIARGKVAADKVTAVAVSGGVDTVAIEGENVAAQIKSLGKTLKTVEGNAAKYKVVKLSAEDIAKLSDSANVREAYKVVSWTGDEDTAHPTQVGETIKIYKDAALLSVTPENGVAGENTVIKFTYSLADGTQKEVSVDLGKAIFESEMGNGMQVVDHKIAIKLDTANEGDFLTVGADGLKLSGVQAAINAAVAAKNVAAEGDAYITATASGTKVSVSADVQGLTVTPTPGGDSTIAGVAQSLVDGAEVATKVAAFTNARIREEIAKLDATVGEAAVAGGNHVAVQVVETDGVVTAVNVSEDDIASAATLASVKKAQEANTTAISGAINEDAQSISLGNKGLQFVAFTAEEIRDAVNK